MGKASAARRAAHECNVAAIGRRTKTFGRIVRINRFYLPFSPFGHAGKARTLVGTRGVG